MSKKNTYNPWRWCYFCNSEQLKSEFKNWTCGREIVDQFIWERQLNAHHYRNVIEWIPFDRFDKVEYLDKGGFGTVYKAKWRDGYIVSWDSKEKNWLRKSEWKYVCLKGLNTFEHTREFLQEVNDIIQSILFKYPFNVFHLIRSKF